MEADMAVETLVRNPNFEKENVEVGVLIADDDAATIAHVRREALHTIEKWSDLNHAAACFSKAVHRVTSLGQQTIDHLEYMFSIAIRTHKGDVDGVQKSLRAVVPHCFEDHSQCDISWCRYLQDPTTYTHRHLPRQEGLSGTPLREKLSTIFEVYAEKAEQLAPLASSQINESFNHTASTKHPKYMHFGRSESMPYRLGSAVCQTNEGTIYVAQVNRKLSISPGENTVKFRSSKDHKRQETAVRCRTQLFKQNRITKKKARRLARLQAENKEGVTYSSGLGFALPNNLSNVSTVASGPQN